jgi:predicted alpha/beta-hydrolase family hydrolase
MADVDLVPSRIEIPIDKTPLHVSGLLLEPPDPRFLYVLAHGAGAGMRHPFLELIADALADESVATFRFQFPYMEAGRRRPDPPHILEATVRSALKTVERRVEDLPVVAGGKSMGGRMTSSVAASETLPGVRGLIFLGFPLHAPGKPGNQRANHLYDIDLPMLFLQGTRDTLARLDLLERVSERLGTRASVHIVEGGDHSFTVLKRSGRTESEVMRELASTISTWGARVLAL